MNFEEFKNAISSKLKKPSWVSSVIKTPLSRNISVLDWNDVVSDIHKLANDTDAVCEYLKSLYTYLFDTFATKLKLDLTLLQQDSGYVYGFDKDGNPKALRTENEGITGRDDTIPTSLAVLNGDEDTLAQVNAYYVKKEDIKFDTKPKLGSTNFVDSGTIRHEINLLTTLYDNIISQTKADTITECNEYTDNSVADVRVIAQNAFDLASGKSKVHVYPYCGYIFTDLRESDAVEERDIGVGDVLLNTERGVPDFIVYSTDRDATVANTVTVLVNDEFYYSPDELEVGVAYHFVESGITIIGIESGIDTSEFVTKEELGDVESVLDSVIAIQNSLIGGGLT